MTRCRWSEAPITGNSSLSQRSKTQLYARAMLVNPLPAVILPPTTITVTGWPRRSLSPSTAKRHPTAGDPAAAAIILAACGRCVPRRARMSVGFPELTICADSICASTSSAATMGHITRNAFILLYNYPDRAPGQAGLWPLSNTQKLHRKAKTEPLECDPSKFNVVVGLSRPGVASKFYLQPAEPCPTGSGCCACKEENLRVEWLRVCDLVPTWSHTHTDQSQRIG